MNLPPASPSVPARTSTSIQESEEKDYNEPLELGSRLHELGKRFSSSLSGPKRPTRPPKLRQTVVSSQDTVSITQRDIRVRRWLLNEQAERHWLRSLNKAQQEHFNLRGRKLQRGDDKPALKVSNPFGVLREHNRQSVEDSPKREHNEGHVPEAPSVPQPPRGQAMRELQDMARQESGVPYAPCMIGVMEGYGDRGCRAFRGRLHMVRRHLRVAEISVQPRDFQGVTFGLYGPAPDVGHNDPAAIAIPIRPGDEGRPEVAPVPLLAPRDPDGGPGDGIIGYRDRRMLDTQFREYTFDHLDFLGIWNSGRVVSSTEQQLFVTHWGVHFNERSIMVALPATLVDELKDWWSNRVRDASWENYALATARSRVLVSELAITAEQQYIANLYGPAVAFIESFDTQQNVTRVVRGAHIDLRRRTIPKNRSALRTTFGKILAGTAVVCAVGLTVVGLFTVKALRAGIAARRQQWETFRARGPSQDPDPRFDGMEYPTMHDSETWRSWLRSRWPSWSFRPSLPRIGSRGNYYRGDNVPSPRLVGIELNPGPSLVGFFLGFVTALLGVSLCIIEMLARRPAGY